MSAADDAFEAARKEIARVAETGEDALDLRRAPCPRPPAGGDRHPEPGDSDRPQRNTGQRHRAPRRDGRAAKPLPQRNTGQRHRAPRRDRRAAKPSGGTQVSDIAPLAGIGGLQTLTSATHRSATSRPSPGWAGCEPSTSTQNTGQRHRTPRRDGRAANPRPQRNTGQRHRTPRRDGRAANPRPPRTQVSDIAPLAGMGGLQDLYLSGTQVSDIAPLAGMGGLQTSTSAEHRSATSHPSPGWAGCEPSTSAEHRSATSRPSPGWAGCKPSTSAKHRSATSRPSPGWAGCKTSTSAKHRSATSRPSPGWAGCKPLTSAGTGQRHRPSPGSFLQTGTSATQVPRHRAPRREWACKPRPQPEHGSAISRPSQGSQG